MSRGSLLSWGFPNLVVSNLVVVCTFYVEALFCVIFRPFVRTLFTLKGVILHAFLHPTAFGTTTLRNFSLSLHHTYLLKRR